MLFWSLLTSGQIYMRKSLPREGGGRRMEIPRHQAKEQAQVDAERIFAWHKRTFTRYWGFLQRQADPTRRIGFTVTADGWVYFADEKTKHTQLLNVPMQSNGAAVLRKAMIDLVFQTDLNVVCSLHDAIYIYCVEADAEEHYSILRRVMNRAVETVIGSEIEIKIGRSDYTHYSGYDAASDLHVDGYEPGEFVSGYYDARGQDTLREGLKLLKEVKDTRSCVAPGTPVTWSDHGDAYRSGRSKRL